MFDLKKLRIRVGWWFYDIRMKLGLRTIREIRAHKRQVFLLKLYALKKRIQHVPKGVTAVLSYDKSEFNLLLVGEMNTIIDRVYVSNSIS